MSPEEFARKAVAKAIKVGDLIRPDDCERCGLSGVIDAHHPDYSQPLNVEFLCRSCHVIHHRTLRGLPVSTPANAIKAIRGAKQVKPHHMAAEFDVDQSTVYRWETVGPPRDLIPQIARFLDTSPAEVMGWEQAA